MIGLKVRLKGQNAKKKGYGEKGNGRII